MSRYDRKHQGCPKNEIIYPSSVIPKNNRHGCEVNMSKPDPDDNVKQVAFKKGECSTKLLDKHMSPMVVRKTHAYGWPLYVALICDENLDDLDYMIHSTAAKLGKPKDGSLQQARNFCGMMGEELGKHYDSKRTGCVEGMAVLWYIDKCFISSLGAGIYGGSDFMNHASCKSELYSILTILPHI